MSQYNSKSDDRNITDCSEEERGNASEGGSEDRAEGPGRDRGGRDSELFGNVTTQSDYRRRDSEPLEDNAESGGESYTKSD